MSLLRQLAFGAGLIGALALYVWWSGHRLDVAQAAAAAEQTRADDLAAELTAARADVRIVTEYVDRVRTVAVRGRDIIQKVPVYVTRENDAACTIHRGFVRVLDAAAAGVDLPAGPGSADAAGSGIALSTVAGSVVGNYTTYHTVVAQLTALQEWVRAHSGPVPAQSTGPP